MTRAAIYLRVSTTRQAEEGLSLDMQRKRCVAYCEMQGWDVVEVLADEGVSGALDSRPQLDRMLQAVRAGEIDAIVIMELSRLGRSLRHLTKLWGELDDRGITIVSLRESIDSSTPVGRLMRSMLGALAEFERELFRERTATATREVAALGFWPGGNTPLGLKAVAERPDGRGHKMVEIAEDEAVVIRKAVEFILQGLSSEEACHRLNGLGLLPRNARRWDRANLRRALKAPYLKGEFTFAKSETPQHRSGYGQGRKNAQPFGPPIPMKVPAILDEATWDNVQKVLEKRATGKAQRVYTLSGHLFGECGFAYTGVFRKGDSRNVRYYQCRTQCKLCRTRRVRADVMEDAVWKAVCDVLSRPDRLLAMATEYLNLRQGQVEIEAEQLAIVDAKIAAHERAIADTTKRAALSGDLFSKSAEQAIAELEEALGALYRHRQQLDSWQSEGRAQSERKRRLWELADHATSRLRDLSPKEKRAILRLLDVKVVVGDERPPMHLSISGTVYDDALAAPETGSEKVGRQGIEP